MICPHAMNGNPIHPVRENCLIHLLTGWAMPVAGHISPNIGYIVDA